MSTSVPSARPTGLVDLSRLPSIQRSIFEADQADPWLVDLADGNGPGQGAGFGQSAEAAALLEGLNPEQKAAVLHSGGPLLIVAGAGSGKTRVLTHRIAYLLATAQARPGEILAITFTNKAAAEMRERVAALVGPAAQHMWVSTFHSACVRILRREAATLGLKTSFSIYDADDARRLAGIVGAELDLDPKRFPAKALAGRISALKNELVDPETYAAQVAGAASSYEGVLAEVYGRYQARLRQAQALDFDDLIMGTVNLLQAFPHVAEHYRRRFRHILVDEYQDTNHAQYVLIRELAGVGMGSAATVNLAPADVTVVGDADQSIYAFRGATVRNILEFEADYPEATTILLEQNYRSTQNILSAANAVIAPNPGRRPKNLWTSSGAGAKVIGYVADSEHDEARFIAGEIDRLGDNDNVRPGDVAIFYRTNAQSRALEEVLIRLGLPYRVVGGTRFYERREIRDAIAYLRAIDNPDDSVATRRVLNLPKRGLGERTEAMVAAHAAATGMSFGAALRVAGQVEGLAARAFHGIVAFVEMMDGLVAAADSGASAAEILDRVLDESGYLAELQASPDPQDASRVENLAELHAVATEFAAAEPAGTLGDFLERVSLVADSDQLPSSDAGGAVTLMTLHTAKGLEFPVVFVTGLEDGTFPFSKAMADEQEMSEERRLAYVGLTRARQRLYISRAAVRTTWGVPNEFPPSRFLADIPPEVIEWRREESSMGRLRASMGGGAAGWARRGTGGRFDDQLDDGGGTVIGRGRGEDGIGHGPGSVGRSRSQGPSSSAGAYPARSGGQAGFGSAKPRPDADIPVLAIGDKVTHDAYGLGTVVAIEGAGRSAVARVDFRSEGIKRLLLRFTPITKL